MTAAEEIAQVLGPYAPTETRKARAPEIVAILEQGGDEEEIKEAIWDVLKRLDQYIAVQIYCRDAAVNAVMKRWAELQRTKEAKHE